MTLICLGVCAGCGVRDLPPPPPLDPVAVSAAAMRELDGNQNGSLEPAELTNSPGLASAVSTVDADKNGMLSPSELTDRLKRYGEFPVLNLPFSCLVRLDGQPLPDAELRLVPEPFFGDSRRVARGKTDVNGVVDFTVEGNKQFGVPVGMYRIEVSKKDAAGQETLPAHYNTSSRLGQEVAFDRRDIESSLALELSSR